MRSRHEREMIHSPSLPACEEQAVLAYLHGPYMAQAPQAVLASLTWHLYGSGSPTSQGFRSEALYGVQGTRTEYMLASQALTLAEKRGRTSGCHALSTHICPSRRTDRLEMRLAMASHSRLDEHSTRILKRARGD